MELKLFQLINWIEENQINISSAAYKSIIELIETGETWVTKDTPHGLSDWGDEIRSIFAKFGIRVYSGYNSGKYFKIKTPEFLIETDYYLFEKEMSILLNELTKILIESDFNFDKLIKISSDNFTMKLYIKNTETLDIDLMEVIRHMPDKDRKLTDKERIIKIINKS